MIAATSKDFGRFLLYDSRGETGIHSVAVEGGGRQLRSFAKMEALRLSEHGDWRKLHLGALDAILGRKPFYRYLEPKLKKIYLNSELKTLRDFNFAIFEVLFSFLMENVSPSIIRNNEHRPEIKMRGKEISETLKGDETILQGIATFGKETLLGLLAMK